jgi:hypothetical protein
MAGREVPVETEAVVDANLALTTAAPTRRLCSPQLQLFTGSITNTGTQTAIIAIEARSGTSNPISLAVGEQILFVNCPVLSIIATAACTLTFLGFILKFSDHDHFADFLAHASVQLPGETTVGDFQPHIVNANQYTGEITTATTTTVVAAATGKTIKIYDLWIWNNGTTAVRVTVSFITSGKKILDATLQASSSVNNGVVKVFLRPWESNSGDGVQIVTGAASTIDYGIGAVQS